MIWAVISLSCGVIGVALGSWSAGYIRGRWHEREEQEPTTLGSDVYACPVCFALTRDLNDHGDWHIRRCEARTWTGR